MRCSRHPEKDAVIQCAQCKQHICDQCAVPAGRETFICNRCAAAKAADDFEQEEHKHLEESERKRQIQGASQRKRTRLKRSIAMSLVAGVIIANAFIYSSRSIPEGETFIPSEHPVGTAVVIDSAIREYSEGHDGKAPQSLDELLGKYLPLEVIAPADLEAFSYSRTSDHSYRLLTINPDDEPLSDVVFTEGGVEW